MNYLKTSDLRARSAVSALALSLAMLASPALAQQAESGVEANEDDAEIVVTGTLIRGVAPGGTNVVSVGQEAVQSSGASTTAQLLQSVPQLNSFGQLQFPAASGNAVTVNRPNLRSLPGFNTGGGSTTLVMLDSHRIVGMGILSTTPDPDVIPPGAIQRLEIVPDGGSAIYGSDAVAGVMNFITRRNFDGVEASARYGFADDYHTFDANGTIGRQWDGGSAFVSYAYAQHDAIYGRDRDFVRSLPTAVSFPATGPTTSLPLTCAPGNVVVGSGTTAAVYGLPFTTATAASVAGKPNQCDTTDDATYYPKEHHHSVMAGFNQNLSDSLSVDVHGYYFNREVESNSGRFITTKTVDTRVAGFADHRVGAETSQSVPFAWGDRDATRQTVGLESWGFTGEFTYRPGGDWRIRLLGNYGESETESHLIGFNDTALGNALNAGLFNPYEPLTSNPAAYAVVNNWETFGRSRQRLVNFRAVADGTLLPLPGGAVKLAVGTEYIKEGFTTTNGTAIPGTIQSGFGSVILNGTTLIPGQAGARTFDLSRDVKAVFGELSVPLFGADNATTLFQELTLSLSGRYDKYSDFGDTFNPKVGVTWKPFDGVRLRGSWGKSFNAPSLADARAATLTTASYFPAPIGFLPAQVAFFKPPQNLIDNGTYPAFDPRQTILTIGGNSPGIQPQTANTLSAGIDFEPRFVPGLKFGATIWRIRAKGTIGTAPFFDRNLWWGFYGHKITINPTDAQIAAATAITDTPVTGQKCQAGLTTNCVYAMMDTRKLNKGEVHVSGIDFYANYRRETGFGGIDFSLNGSYELDRKESAAIGAPFQDLLTANNNLFRFASTVGADIGNLRAQVTWYYRQGYDLSPPQGLIRQTHIDDYNVFNLFFKYDVPSDSGMLKDLSFTLNVDNVFDQDPPFDASPKGVITQNGYGNGQTLGRLFQFGVSKKF